MNAEPSPPVSVLDPVLVLPQYSAASLADLLPSVGARLGLPGRDVLGLAESARYVVLLVDGLGWNLLQQYRADVPYLGGLLEQASRLTSGAPSTTVTSLTSLGTGLPPGQHGMAGYTCRIPETGEILNPLLWESAVSPLAFQPKPTYFERLREAGVSVSSVAPARFADSGLTAAALRGPAFFGVENERDEELRIELICRQAKTGSASVVYAYERELDHTGHKLGVGSWQWLSHLHRIDDFCERLRECLDDDVRLLITADHGMLDIDPAKRLVIEEEPSLMAGVDDIAGEGRLRQLYVQPNSIAAVAQRWRDRLGERAWVCTRGEAVEQGWFGPMDDALAARFGDILVAMRTDWALMSNKWPGEMSLVGMHGSLTADEMFIPLLVD